MIYILSLYYSHLHLLCSLSIFSACNFSAMMFMLKSVGKVGIKDGHVCLHRGPGFVAVDQYLTLNSRTPSQQQKAVRQTSTKSAKGSAQYPYYCELCKVQGNSDVSYRGHLTGIRHRYQLVVKAVGTRRYSSQFIILKFWSHDENAWTLISCFIMRSGRVRW